MNGLPGLILAGGLSRRMGENKALVPFGPGRLIDHVAARLARQCETVLLNTNTPLPGLEGIPRIADDLEGFAGPLAGIAAGLGHLRQAGLPHPHLLSVAADTPFFPADLVERLEEARETPDEIVLAAGADGEWHPVFALWPVSLEADLRAWLCQPENRRLKDFICRHPHRIVR